MRFALIENNRVEAQPKQQGICPICSQAVIAKCGDQKVWHWAHRSIISCDSWWEPETEWHRAWKNNFLPDCQEVIHTDEVKGEKHIADVKTTHGLVIEFQHSHLDSHERTSRERFYKNMVWVVDCTRLKRDYPRFLKGKESFRTTKNQGIFFVDFPEKCFPSVWVGRSVHVVFDFKGIEAINNTNDWRNYLYYLFPKTNVRESMVAVLTRESFINNIIEGKWFNQQQESQKQIENPPIKDIPILPQRQSQYIYHKGRFVRRRRL